MVLLASLVLGSTFSTSEAVWRIVLQGCTLLEEFVILAPSRVRIALMLTLAPLVQLITCWLAAVHASLALTALLGITWMWEE